MLMQILVHGCVWFDDETKKHLFGLCTLENGRVLKKKKKHGRAENINLVNDVKWICGEEKEDGSRLELQVHFVHLTSTLRHSYDQ